MTFWQGLKESYRGSFAFLVACPLLALVPVFFEMLQHVVEFHMGAYDSIEASKALDANPVRLGFGMVKAAAITASFYWVIRWLATRDRRFAATADPTAIRLFSGFFIFRVGMTAVQLFLVPGTGLAVLVETVVGEAVTALIAAWGVASALGNRSIGPVQSVALMARYFLWSFALIVFGMLPLFVLHTALGVLATVGPRWLLWPSLIVDSLMVSWLAALIIATTYFAAKRAAQLEGLDLMRQAARASG